jgi:hypothetical protein
MVCIWVSAASMLAAGLYIFPFRVKQQYNERCLQNWRVPSGKAFHRPTIFLSISWEAK